eukprot:2601876-Prymnesium_polylepis.1
MSLYSQNLAVIASRMPCSWVGKYMMMPTHECKSSSPAKTTVVRAAAAVRMVAETPTSPVSSRPGASPQPHHCPHPTPAPQPAPQPHPTPAPMHRRSARAPNAPAECAGLTLASSDLPSFPTLTLPQRQRTGGVRGAHLGDRTCGPPLLDGSRHGEWRGLRHSQQLVHEAEICVVRAGARATRERDLRGACATGGTAADCQREGGRGKEEGHKGRALGSIHFVQGQPPKLGTSATHRCQGLRLARWLRLGGWGWG